MARTCAWFNERTKEVHHLRCFTPEGFIPDAWTELEDKEALQAERHQRKQPDDPWWQRQRQPGGG